MDMNVILMFYRFIHLSSAEHSRVAYSVVQYNTAEQGKVSRAR